MTKKHFKDLDAPVLFPTSMLLTFNKLSRNVYVHKSRIGLGTHAWREQMELKNIRDEVESS